MTSLDSHVASLLADPQREARAFARAGGRVIGYIGPDIPVELLLAADALPVRLRGDATRSTAHADRFVETSFAPDVRSIAETWLTGGLDHLESVVFPRSDDSAQRLYYYVCELQRRGLCGGPKPVIHDLARIRRATSEAHTLAATRMLAADIGADLGRLGSAGQRLGERITVLNELAALRLNSAPPAGSQVLRILRAAGSDWTMTFDQLLAAWLTSPPVSQPTHRLLLAGSAPPDERLHLAVEAAGSTVVRELSAADPSIVARSSDSLAGIAQCSHGTSSLAQEWMVSPDSLVEQSRIAKVDGVLLWIIEEDEALVWQLPEQFRALKSARVPTLVLTRQAWNADTETLNQVTQFAQVLAGHS